MKLPYFEVIPHTADFKLRVHAETVEQLFQYALIGMFQSIRPRAQGCIYKRGLLWCPSLPVVRNVSLTSINQEILLIDFLNEALYLSDVHNEAYLDCNVRYLTDKELKADIRGIEITGFEVVEIKAVTYHQLAIEKVPQGFKVDILFDV